MTNVAQLLADSAAAVPDAPSLKLDDVVVTFAALEAQSERVAGLLAERGVRPGDRVALISPNLPQMPAIYYGALRYGAIVVPLNPLLKAREVEYHLRDSGAKLVFAWDGIRPEADPGAEAAGAEVIGIGPGLAELLAGVEPRAGMSEAAPDDTAVILYTSGTTGRPKGAELTHENLRSNAAVSQALFDTGPGDVVFGGLPFFHIFGQTCALNSAVLAGACVTLLPRFDPAKALEIIARDKVTIFEGVPTMYVALLRCPALAQTDTSTVRLAASGGSPLPLEILREFESTFSATLLEGYGLSETSPVVTFNQLDGIRKPGSIGTPVRGARLRILDEDGKDVPDGEVGEIAVAGGYVMKGYWNNPDATAAAIPDGWFRTGDLGRRDEDGVYFIVDRKKDMILRGGYNIYPREVEEVLYEHPAVAEAAVVGVPDELHGEEVVAVVALKDGADRNGSTEKIAAEIASFVQERVAAYKYPRRVVIVDALPKGPTGKILKREIKV
ncbi:MAG: long-chain fatty acid--CoA ligase [Actinomycetales bacterium]